LPGLTNGVNAFAYVDSGSVTVNSVTINPTNGSAGSAGYLVGAGALNVTGAITVGGTGNTATYLQFNNTGALNAGSIDFSGSGGTSQQQYLTLAAGGSLTVGGGTGTITHSGTSTLNILGRSAAPTTINANINAPINTYLAAGDQATGAITIGSGNVWEVFVTRVAFNLNNNGGSPAPKSGTLTIDGGSLKSQALYILQNSGNSTGANNSAVLNLDNGGTIETFDIARAAAPGSSLTFNWNDGTIRGYGNAVGTQLRSVDANPLVVSIAGTGNHTFQVQGNETTTVQSTAILVDKAGENGTLNKTGAGTLIINSASTYSGSTTVTDGALELATNGALRFVIGGNGTNNALKGNGATSVNGQFVFDLSGASTNTNSTWTIVANTLSNSYGTNFSVSGFDGVIGGNWTNTTNGVNYVFAQSNSVLSVQSTGGVTPYNAWVAYWTNAVPGFTNTAGTDNPDGDPFDNNEEFAFDGNPTVGTGALLTATNIGTNAVFNYVAQTNTNAVTYLVQSTTNLTNSWTNASVTISNSLNQTNPVISQTNIYERKEFVVPASGAMFYRVQVTITGAP
jgi:autotransporter-associated beta strand protein